MEFGRETHRPEARWFVHEEGHTLGPLSAPELLDRLRAGEILPSAKAYRPGDKGWTSLEEHPALRPFETLIRPRRARDLESLPSPQILRTRSAPVAIPKLSFAEIPPPVSAKPAAEAIPAPQIARDPEPLPEPAIESAALTPVEIPPAPANLSAPECEPEQTLPPAPTEPEPQPEMAPAPLDPLLLAAAELERTLDALPELEEEQRPEPDPSRQEPGPVADTKKPETVAISAAIPSRPEIRERPGSDEFLPVYLREPRSEPKKEAASGQRVLRIELKLPERPLRLALLLALVIGAAWYVMGPHKNKTRDLKDFHLPDPSSPTTTPLEASDPNPPLKAPTRPQRE